MKDATDRQLEVLEFMRRYQREQGMPPTLREISDEFGWSSHYTAVCVVRSMVRKGLVTHRRGIARAYIAKQPEVA
jgi:SOS-response transcriptional repressor LexA